MGTIEEVEGEVAVLEGLKDSPIASVTYIGGGTDTWLVLTVKAQADLLARRTGTRSGSVSAGWRCRSKGRARSVTRSKVRRAELIKQLSR